MSQQTSKQADFKTLPNIMVAPNGARLTRDDHPALPVTISQIIDAAILCKNAGADGIHAHVRDKDQKHILDAGLYKELLAELEKQLPDFYIQITTEAVGQYTAQQQRQLVRDVNPKAVSISISEMLSDGNEIASRDLYFWAMEAGIHVQHIFYSITDVARFLMLVEKSIIPEQNHQLLFVLGRYTKDNQSHTSNLDPFLTAIRLIEQKFDWAVCAFGKEETNCLKYAEKKGGKVRLGFENNLLNHDGSIAQNNAARVLDFLKS